jgi:S-adenosylmethionine:tRNA ribosyltransferase-isomerase
MRQSANAPSPPAAAGGLLTLMPFLDYHLPPDLIAQEPAAERDQSRLLVIRRTNGSFEHRHFLDLPDLLDAGDLLVLNDTRVVPARLLGRRARTGGKWEGLYLGESDEVWEMLCRLRGRLVEGETIVVGEPALTLQFVGRAANGHFLFRPESPASALDLLSRYGQVPLPPYVHKGREQADDAERYQTVYARRPGAVAAPTAGLHFTDRVFGQLRDRGIETTTLTLHVGLGTFQPLQSDDPTRHVMHREWCELPAAATEAVNACRARGRRVVAVGTTAVRTLESAAARSPAGPLAPWSGETDLFIYPPYNFKAVDALVTNFHLPRTSLLFLVAAFAGEDLIRRAYEEAIARRYRFYSYGDATLVL